MKEEEEDKCMHRHIDGGMLKINSTLIFFALNAKNSWGEG
jgi:hypothetical protein